MRKENLLLLFLILAVVLIFIYPSFGWNIRSLMMLRGGQASDYQNLLSENQSLKTDLAKLSALKFELPPYKGNLIQASVYSDYPFNFKSRLLVNKGEKDGVKAGQPVLVFSPSSKPILAGKVEEVFANDSLVETVFDPMLQISVKVGGTGVSSLLKGGGDPKLTLIPKDSKVQDGDAVYSVDSSYPFGLAVGIAKNPRLSSDQFFEEADLETAYNPNDFQAVFIDISYDLKNINQ